MKEALNIPKHWQLKKLKDICDSKNGLRRGPFGSAIKKEFFVPNGYKVYEQSNAIYDDSNKGNYYINEKKYQELINFKVQPGDFIVSCSGTLGKISQLPKNAAPGIINQALLRIKIAESLINRKYFLYFFKSESFQRKIISQGTAMLNLIGIKDFKEIPIPLPPLAEQQTIVAKIEELLSDLDNGVQQLQTAQQQLKVYRQSLLKAAFEGKLLKKKGVWKNVKLGEVANAIDPQPSHRTPPIDKNGIPYVSIKDFDPRTDKINFTKARKVSKEVLNEHLDRYKLEIGDFVIGKIGTIGKPVRIVLPQKYTLSANIVLIQPRKVNSTYLYYFFQSNSIEKAFKAGMNATTQAAFGIQKVRELIILLPNEEEQNLIVSELESKLTVCDKIEETIQQSLQQAESLRQSILKKAFEGRLVAATADYREQMGEFSVAAEQQANYPKI